eukprot:Ihof_evm2s406 gene=Ihof_evmTU2s406
MSQQATAEQLETVLLQLLTPDSAVIQEYTPHLKAILKTSNGVPLLVQVLQGSQNEGVRQMTTVLLRQRIVKVWMQLSADTKTQIKDLLLVLVLQDPSKAVKHSIAGVVSVIAKYEVPTNQWPAFMPWLNQCNHSEKVTEREIGMFVLSSLCETMGGQLKPFLPSLFELFHRALQDTESPAVQLFTIKTITELVEHLDESDMHLLRVVIPAILQVIKVTLESDETEAISAMDFFSELMEADVPLKGDEVKAMIGFFLEVASNKNLENSTRVIALNHIISLSNRESKYLISSGLVAEIMNHVFPILAAADEEVVDDDEEDEIPASKYAAQIIDNFALNLPPTAVVGPALQLVGSASQSASLYDRKAAMVIMMVLAEGCSEALSKMLGDILPVLFRGLDDPEMVVREAACLTLSQFAEYMQPDISEHCDAVIPRLLLAMDASSNILKEKSCYAMQVFAGQLGSRVEPYMAAMMEKLHRLLVSDNRGVQEIAVLAIAAVAVAAGPAFEPYGGEMYTLLKQLMTITNEETMSLRANATDAMGAMIRAMGRVYFQNNLPELMQLSMAGMELDEPEISQCTFGLWASLSSVFKDDFAPFLHDIVPHIMAMVESDEGVVQHRAGDDEDAININSDDEDEGEIESCTVIGVYMDAKETAINSLAELCEHVPQSFLPYIEKILPILLELLTYKYSAEIKKAAATTLVQFMESIHIAYPPPSQWVSGLPVSIPLSMPANVMVEAVMPALVSVMQADEDRLVVLAVCEALSNVVVKIGPASISNILDAWVHTVSKLVGGTATCQNIELDDDEDAEHSVAEYDSMLMESACELVGATAKLLGASFSGAYMDNFTKQLMRFYRKKSTESERSVCMATFADIIEGMGPAIQPYVMVFYPTLLKAIGDGECEVRSNAAFAMGLLAVHSGQSLHPYYPLILQSLHTLFTNQPQLEATDNACGAVCRMIIAGPDCLPLDQVVPVLLNTLPLKVDFEENEAVLNAFFTLIRGGSQP